MAGSRRSKGVLLVACVTWLGLQRPSPPGVTWATPTTSVASSPALTRRRGEAVSRCITRHTKKPGACYRRRPSLNAHTMLVTIPLLNTGFISKIKALLRLLGGAFIPGAALLGLFELFEQGVHTLEHKLPRALRPVVYRVLSEMSALGLVSLLIQCLPAVGLDRGLAMVSRAWFGDSHALLETFEFAHMWLFVVSVAFFAACGLTVGAVANELGSTSTAARHAVLMEELFKDEPVSISTSSSKSGMNLLPYQKRFRSQANFDGASLPLNFQFGPYLEEVAGSKLQKLVDLQAPQLAKMLFPMFAVITYVFNGPLLGTHFELLETSRLFQLFLVCSSVFVLFLGAWNNWKMGRILDILRPKPKSADTKGDAGVQSSKFEGEVPNTMLERIVDRTILWPWGAPVRNSFDRLFGILGSNGPSFYLRSMRVVLFSAVANISWSILLAVDCFERGVAFEFFLFCALIAQNIGNIRLLGATFLKYNLVTSIENLRSDQALTIVTQEQNSDRFRTTLASMIAVSRTLRRFQPPSFPPEPLKVKGDEQAQWEDILRRVNPDQLWDLKVLFNWMDESGDGEFSEEEVEVLALRLGYPPNIGKAFFKHMDKDGDGGISFLEFAAHVLQKDTEPVDVAVLDSLFVLIDADKGGSIGTDEFCNCLEGLGFDTRGSQALFQEIAGSPLRKINRRDFRAYLEKHVLSKLAV